MEREGLFWFGSVGSFFDIVVCDICVVGAFLSFLRIFGVYCLEEFPDSNTNCTEEVTVTFDSVGSFF